MSETKVVAGARFDGDWSLKARRDAHASGHLSDALRDLAPRVHEYIHSTDHTVTEDKISGEVVETLTVRWKRADA